MKLFKYTIILTFLTSNLMAGDGLKLYGISSTFDDSNPRELSYLPPLTLSLTDSYRLRSNLFIDDIIGQSSTFGLKPNHNNFPCKDQFGNVQYGFSLYNNTSKLYNTSKAINRKVSCSEALSWGGYDNCSCSFYESCTLSVFGASNIKELISDLRFRSEVAPELQMVSANSYVDRVLKKDLQEIEDTAELRVYAKMTGVQINPLNQCEYKNNMKIDCNEDEFEKDIAALMKGCNSKSGFSCFSMDSEEYKKHKGSSEDKKLTIEKYIYDKAVLKVTPDTLKESEIAQGLFEVLKNEGTEKNKKFDNGKIYEFLKINQEKLDPVLKRVFFKKINIDQFLADLKGPHTDIEKFKESIQSFRASYLIKEFSGNGCEKKKSLRKICENKMALKTTKKRDFERLDKGELSDLFSFEKLDEDYDRYRMSKLNPVISNKDEYTHLVKAYRCFMMSYQLKFDGRIDGDNFCIDPTGEGRSAFQSVTENSSLLESQSDEDEKRQSRSLASIDEGVDFSSVESSNGEKNISIRGNDYSETNQEKMADGSISGNTTEDLNRAVDDSLSEKFGRSDNFDSNSNFQTQNNLYNSAASFNKNIIDEKKIDTVIDEKSNTDVSTISIEEKIKELNKKLAEAESNFEKAKKASEKKNEIETVPSANNDQMKALETQIAQLKNELNVSKQKIVSNNDERVPVVRQDQSSSSSSQVGSAVHSKELENKNHTAIASQGQVAVASSGSASADQNLSKSTTGINIPNQGTSVVASGKTQGVGLVLTKVDGLSQDAFVDTINSKIKEFNGEPFLIEEGGYVKEIVPVLKDGRVVMDDKGQPIFEKVVKGKVTDLKSNKSKRIPASVTNQADLNKIEAQKIKKEVDRIKYKSLRDLTDQAVK